MDTAVILYSHVGASPVAGDRGWVAVAALSALLLSLVRRMLNSLEGHLSPRHTHPDQKMQVKTDM